MVERAGHLRERKRVPAALVLDLDEPLLDVDVRGPVLTHGAELDQVAVGHPVANREQQLEGPDHVRVLGLDRGRAGLHRVGRRGLLAVVDDRLGQRLGDHPVEEVAVLDRSHEDADLVAAHLVPGLDPVDQGANRGQRAGRVLDVPAPAREVVDHGDLVAARREPHRGGPSEVPVTSQDQDSHGRARVADRPAPGRGSDRCRARAQTAPGRASILVPPCQRCPLTPSSLFPPELTALRAAGLVIAALLAAFAIWRRRSLRNVDVLILLLVALGLAIVAGTRASRRDPRRLLVQARERDPDRRGRRDRHPDPVRARGAGPVAGIADHARALRGARGACLGAVRRPPAIRSASGTRSACWSPPTTRPTASATSSTGFRTRSAGSRPPSWSSTTARATAPGRSPPSTARRSPAT